MIRNLVCLILMTTLMLPIVATVAVGDAGAVSPPTVQERTEASTHTRDNWQSPAKPKACHYGIKNNACPCSMAKDGQRCWDPHQKKMRWKKFGEVNVPWK